MAKRKISPEQLAELRDSYEGAREQIEGNPFRLLVFLAGDSHMHGLFPGTLDAARRGVLKEAGRWGKKEAERTKRLHALMDDARVAALEKFEKEFGGLPDRAELAAEALGDVQTLLRFVLEEHYEDRVREFYASGPSEADAAQDEAMEKLSGGNDPMYG